MGTASLPSKVRLFIAFLYNETAQVEEILRRLDDRFGDRQFSHGPVPFIWTDYYNCEMGDSLKKLYFNYSDGITRDMLPAIKTFTNSLEQSTADSSGKRRVNIDPGYVARDKVVLATTKDFYHRLYLADSIFGEVTLHYRKGRFRYFSWTYPDFRTPEVLRFFERIRSLLVKELRDSGEQPGGPGG